jgi:integrase
VDRVAIHGTKRDGRDRIVPRVSNPTRRSMGWDQYGDALKALGLQPYDARRGFSHLMEEAGITRIRRKMYMGHALGDVTGGYEKAEVSAFCVGDSAVMAAKISEVEERQRQDRKSGMRTG